jgi:hypothetical protein
MILHRTGIAADSEVQNSEGKETMRKAHPSVQQYSAYSLAWNVLVSLWCLGGFATKSRGTVRTAPRIQIKARLSFSLLCPARYVQNKGAFSRPECLDIPSKGVLVTRF